MESKKRTSFKIKGNVVASDVEKEVECNLKFSKLLPNSAIIDDSRER